MNSTLREILRDSGEIDYDRADPRDIPACALTYSLEDQDPDAAMYSPRRTRPRVARAKAVRK